MGSGSGSVPPAALGHFSAGFTLNTYTHATPQMKRDAAVKIGEVVDGRM